MSAQMGGLKITDMQWTGPHTLQVKFASKLLNRFFQLYAGRRLVGVTESTTARRILGQLMPTRISAPMTVLAVTPSDRLTNFGPQLPRRPWNRYVLDWTADDYPADSRFFDLTSSPAADEEVSDSNLLARIEYVGDIAYSFDLPELTAGGLWKYRLTPRDNALPLGNAGTPQTVEVAALVYPADLVRNAAGERFTCEIEAGAVHLSFVYQ